MHRADPRSDRPPSPHKRGHRTPDGGPASVLLQPPPDLGPADLTPRRARVTIREVPLPPQRDWVGMWRRHLADVVALAVVAAAVAVLLLR